MACAAVLVPGLLRGSVGAICSQAALSKSTRGALRHLTLTSIMKSKRKTDHLERTANALRQEVVTAAKVCGAANESPSVKRLRLLVADQDFSFKAGQWGLLRAGTKTSLHLDIHHEPHCEFLEKRDFLSFTGEWSLAKQHQAAEGAIIQAMKPQKIDFFIPGISVVGGFSICSSPRLLEQERVIELAVKYTNHPPAVWIHNQCALDSEVAVRVGGEFFFDPQPAEASRNLVLIAGGVGINPLLSILRHAADLHREWANQGSGYEIGTIRLFYSAKNTSELLFKKNILDLVNEFPEKIACSLHVTKQTTPISAELKPYITGDLCIITVACMQRIYIPASAEPMPFAINEGRITEKEIREHISRETLFYICGPPPMTDFFSKQLENSHVPKEHICFEKWW